MHRRVTPQNIGSSLAEFFLQRKSALNLRASKYCLFSVCCVYVRIDIEYQR